MTFYRDAVMGQDATIAKIVEIKARAERGEVECFGVRLFMVNGTWEDIVIGGTEEERAEMLVMLNAKND